MAFGALIGSVLALQARKRMAEQQAYERAEQAKLDAWRQAQVDAENQRIKDQEAQAAWERQNYYREHGLDPNTGKPLPNAPMPKSLTQVNPNNKGKPLQPGSIAALTADWQHAAAMAAYYAQQPPTEQNTAQAQLWNARAVQAAGFLKEAQIQAAQDQREAARQAAEQQRALQSQQFMMQRLLQSEQFQERMHSMPTYRDLHPLPRVSELPTVGADAGAVAIAKQKMDAAYKAYQQYVNSGGKPAPGKKDSGPPLSPRNVAAQMIANIQMRPGMDPRKKAATIAAIRAMGEAYPTIPYNPFTIGTTPAQ